MTDLTFANLIDIEQIRELLEAHYKITGVGAGILDTDENILVAVGYHDICTCFHLVHPKAKLNCRESDAYIKAHLSECKDGYLDYRCKNGLVDVAVPIIIRGEHLATFFTGQFFYDDEKPDLEYFGKQAEKFGFDEGAYLEALGRVPVFSRERIGKTVEYYRTLVRIITGIGIQNLELRREAAELNEAKEALLISRFCIDKAGIGIYRTDENGTIFSVNDYACKCLGYAEDELLALSVFDIDPVITRERMIELKEILDAAGSVTHESIHQRKDGTTFPVEITANLLEFNGKTYGISFVKDITERKRVEEELLLTQHCVDKASIAIHMVHRKGRISHANEQMCRNLGYTRAELHLMSVFDFDPEITPEKLLEVERLARENGSCIFESMHRRKDGTSFPVEITVNYWNVSGHKLGMAFVQDITERKRAEEALLKSGQMLLSVLDNFPGAVFWKDRNSVYMGCNRNFSLAAGFSEPAEIIGRNDHELPWKNDVEWYLADDRQVIESGLPKLNIIESLPQADGRVAWFETSKVPLFDADGKVFAVLGVSKDISERIRVEEAIRKAYDEMERRVRERTGQLSSLTAELSLAEERERRRIATELHDQVGQALVLGKLKLNSLKQGLPPAEFEALFGEIRGLLGRSIEDIRSLTFQLSPPLLYEVGFEAAVEWLAEELGDRNGLRVNFRDDGKNKPLNEEARVTLYRMVRELLINIVKHADAKRVDISIERFMDTIRVIVSDDGSGFDSGTIQRELSLNRSFGLFNIRHRTEYLGGSFSLESEIGRGTRSTITLPLTESGINDYS